MNMNINNDQDKQAQYQMKDFIGNIIESPHLSTVSVSVNSSPGEIDLSTRRYVYCLKKWQRIQGYELLPLMCNTIR